MHANERERIVLELLEPRGFISFQELDHLVDASPATIRRDLERMAQRGVLRRVRGGAELVRDGQPVTPQMPLRLAGVPFHENIARNKAQKEAIGRAAAALCRP